MPTLADGELEVETIHHDESGFHANDYKWDYYLKVGEQVLRKKERDWLMMVSDFVCQATGHLVLSDELWEAELAKPAAECLPRDAHVIITLSSKAGSDDYWNMDQMIAQVRHNCSFTTQLMKM